MPFRVDFFQNLLIRISGRISLNDPFEFMPSAKYIAQLFIRTKHYRLGRTSGEIESFFENMDSPRDWKFIEGPTGDFGVVSLTPFCDNISMWSHYSDSHKGIVVGFDVGSPFFTDKFKQDNDLLLGAIHKVKYSKKRVTRFRSFHDPLLTKSSAWKYEAEHRLIANLFKCDCMLIREADAQRLQASGAISGLRTQPFFRDLHEITEAEFPGSLSRHPEVLFMAEVPANAINYIGIGSRMTEGDQAQLQSILDADRRFDHVAIEKFYIDKYEFKLNKTPLRNAQTNAA